MKFILLKQGESLSDVAARISSRKGAPPMERTLTALREANPGLAEIETRPATADTVVVLPRVVAGAPPVGQQPTLPETLLDSMLSRLDDAFASIANVLQLEEQEAAAAESRLQSAELKKLARSEPELERELVEVTQRAAERVAIAKTARAAQPTLVKLISDDVASLRKAMLEMSSFGAALNEIEPPEEPPVERPGKITTPVSPKDRTNTPASKAGTGQPTGKSGIRNPPRTRKKPEPDE